MKKSLILLLTLSCTTQLKKQNYLIDLTNYSPIKIKNNLTDKSIINFGLEGCDKKEYIPYFNNTNSSFQSNYYISNKNDRVIEKVIFDVNNKEVTAIVEEMGCYNSYSITLILNNIRSLSTKEEIVDSIDKAKKLLEKIPLKKFAKKKFISELNSASNIEYQKKNCYHRIHQEKTKGYSLACHISPEVYTPHNPTITFSIKPNTKGFGYAVNFTASVSD